MIYNDHLFFACQTSLSHTLRFSYFKSIHDKLHPNHSLTSYSKDPSKKSTLSDYWGIWANNIAEIAQNHINHLKDILSDEKSKAQCAFDAFHKELKSNLNDSITQEEALEMLGQHLVTRPVFEALFEGNEFVQNNSISQAMERILKELDKTN
ncbi:putative helicase [Bartonella fuyuanensis]|uniref:Putative helicase n=1 Tax=Bartonella fuyuanensis TaxID=1460968 RepID=A0A840DSZ9_9HYPH|nr:putative helicase [Bartonella fuyuanensis]